MLFHHYFSICYFHKPAYHTHTSSALYALINPSYSPAFFSFQPFLHTFISFFHFHCLPLSRFHLASHFSTFHFIPISLSMFVYVCVFVAGWCLWLFFRQQPRRLDCHNLWSWVISVSNPNLGTGPFFLSSSLPPPLPLSLSSLFSHQLSLFLPFPVTLHHFPFSAVAANDHYPWIHVTSYALNLEFVISNASVFDWLACRIFILTQTVDWSIHPICNSS